MNDENFTLTFLVEKSPEETIDAIRNVRGWWSEGIEGSTEKPGDEFTYRHEDLHYSKQKLVELVPGKRVVWLVVDALLSFTEDQREWKGTHLRFEVAKKPNGTEVRFTHVGLVPEHECFDACSKGWTFYAKDSLRRLITTGKGRPDPKEKAPVQVRKGARGGRSATSES